MSEKQKVGNVLGPLQAKLIGDNWHVLTNNGNSYVAMTGPGEKGRANALLFASISDLLEALHEISKGIGRFSSDQLEHAGNCIEDMKEIARTAITKAQG